MPLVLTFHEGEDFFVGDAQFVVSDIVSAESAIVTGSDRSFEILQDKAAEILPGCRVSLSDRSGGGTARLTFEAPRSMNIATGDKIRAGRQPDPAPTMSSDQPAVPLSVSKTALEQAQKAGIYGNVAEQLVDLVGRAAPVTHVAGNRRYERFVFLVDDEIVKSVVKLTEAELEALDDRHHRERTGKTKPWVRPTGGGT
jgi:hypothetical protein